VVAKALKPSEDSGLIYLVFRALTRTHRQGRCDELMAQGFLAMIACVQTSASPRGSGGLTPLSWPPVARRVALLFGQADVLPRR